MYGVDWRIPIDEAWKLLGDDNVAIQGNLDPATLLSNWTLVESRTTKILSSVKGRRGHVFNLGHGVLPGTDPLQLKKLVRLVQRTTRR
jgi:uroporphyrinogen decarboxylase